jgi:chemotaxis protein CheD
MLKVEHHVKIGEIRSAGEGAVLKTVLGSCVGIALIWKRKNKCALAHCLLPTPTVGEKQKKARYVTHTVPLLLEFLGATLEDIIEIEAVVAGGGQMMEVDQPYIKFVVGEENLRTAKRALDEHHIRIKAFIPGGDQGTKMRVDCGSGEFEIEKLPKVV